MVKTTEIVHFPAPPAPYYLECGYTVYAPGDEHPNRRNMGKFDLIMMKSGTLFIGEEDKNWALTAGQSLLLLPNRYHYSVQPCEEETHFYWIHFHSICAWAESSAEQQMVHVPQPDEHYQTFLTSPYSIQLPKMWDMPYPERAYQLMEKLLQSPGTRQSSAFWTQQQAFEELLRMMDLRQLEQYTSPIVAVAEKTEAFIKNNYKAELTSKDMSEALHYHYNYITRCMKQVYGMTPNDYLQHYRLEQAKLLLLKTEWPIAEIAKYVGFKSTPYFSNRFTIKNGCSPLQFRKQYSVEANK
ncbi:helix-turn-helix domain-containing protein [Paenibacillus lentus]|uniref:AraC family transcriptional regulator n=1 Tax=Paenibacillus lentus TaxID=1338368 RepID=A0A3Q8SB69_9BACL|nr:AraC family transcriptional regulator [Paenibacillus lentus]AZK46738.1 AraC family transcriptional regulator [Paenibacillus lentus]